MAGRRLAEDAPPLADLFKPKATDLEPEIARAVETFLHVAMRERRGPGAENHGPGEYSYTMHDILVVLHDICPDAIARLLQAGADKYLQFEAAEGQ